MKFRPNCNEVPKKPKTQSGQISMLWDEVYLGIKHKMEFLDTKINFVLLFLAILMGLVVFSLVCHFV